MTEQSKAAEFPEHVHKAFEAALVSCMDYFKGVWVEKDREIEQLKKRVADGETEIARLKKVLSSRGQDPTASVIGGDGTPNDPYSGQASTTTEGSGNEPR